MSRLDARPKASSEHVLRRMTYQRRRDTAPEIAIRQILYSRGYRYRIDYPIPHSRRRIDIALLRHKVAVFVDGCFWHSCPIHGSTPKKNKAWWASKLQANDKRDLDTNRLLRDAGWRVVRVWEHETPVLAVERVIQMLAQ